MNYKKLEQYLFSHSKHSAKLNPAIFWENIYKNSVKLPFTKINRSDFLQKVLKPYCDEKQISKAISETPQKAGISNKLINKISKKCIVEHLTKVTSSTFALAFPWKFIAMGAVPTDLAQIVNHALKLSQKMAFLNGLPDLIETTEDQRLFIYITFLDIMFAEKKMIILFNEFIKSNLNENKLYIGDELLRNYSLNYKDELSNLFGEKITKIGIYKIAGKFIPFIGILISSVITFNFFIKMANSLNNELSNPLQGKNP